MMDVIITAYDQHRLTVSHIEGCMRSSFLPTRIIVVNDGGEDSLKGMIEKMDRKCEVVYCHIDDQIRWNQNGARNLGLLVSTSPYIALEDNDHIPHEDFYRDALGLMYEYDKVCVKRRLVVSEEDVLNKPVEEWKPLHTRGKAEVIGLIKRELLLDAKGFDENFCGYYGWDVPDFVERTNKLGAKLIANGCYYVVPTFSNKDDRPFSDSGKPKMEAINYHLWKRNLRNSVIQPEKGIINFRYTITRFKKNI